MTYRRFHDRFGTAGVLIAVVALVAALSGTALAAKGALTGKQKKEVEKIAKKFQGTGPAGAAGAPGKDGTNGTNGAAGKDGGAGANGKSVVVSSTAPGCSEGGVSVEVEGTPASKKEVCNGEEGLKGEKGEPWTAGGILPPGQTETGTFLLSAPGKEEGARYFGAATTISFFIPLGAPLDAAHTIYVEGTVPAECESSHDGSAGPTNPEADPGYLCVYPNAAGTGLSLPLFRDSGTGNESGAGIVGATLIMEASGDGPTWFAEGTWAVTAAE